MSNYRRLISYIYAYEGGIKGKNIGFAKIEIRNGQCRIHVNVKKIFLGNSDIGVYLLSPKKEILLGRIFIRNGAGEFRTNVSAGNVENSGCGMEQCYGLTIHETENTWRTYTTIWEDAVAQAAELQLADVTSDKMALQVRQEQHFSVAEEIEKELEAEAARREAKAPWEENGRKSEEMRQRENEARESEKKQEGEARGDERKQESEVRGDEEEQESEARGGERKQEKEALVSERQQEGEARGGKRKQESEARGDEERHESEARGDEGKPESEARANERQQEEWVQEDGKRKEPGLNEDEMQEGKLGYPEKGGLQEEKKTESGQQENRANPDKDGWIRGTPVVMASQDVRVSEAASAGEGQTGMAMAEEFHAARKPAAKRFPGELMLEQFIADKGPDDRYREGTEAGAREEVKISRDRVQEKVMKFARVLMQGKKPETEARQEMQKTESGAVMTEPGDPERLRELDRQDQEAAVQGTIWNQLQRRYPKVLAFDYAHDCEILSIKPQDIGILPRENWVYGNNSFLLHGYYNYRHLILARLENPGGEPRYLLGVPGHYFSNEKNLASMFGFPHFVLAKKQPEQDGRFGYWYTDLRL